MEGDGFRINITLPQEMLGEDFSIAIDSNTIILNFKNSTYFKNALTSNIIGVFQKGENLVSNQKGEIIITQW